MIYFLDKYLEEVIAGTALIVMSVLVFAQAIMRYVFKAPMSWPDEIAVYCMIWFVYLSASWAVRERAHIRVLNFITLFPKPISQWLIYLSDLIWFISGIFIFWQGMLLHFSLAENSYRSPVLSIDQKWPYLAVSAGFALMNLRLIQIYYRWMRYGEPLNPDPTDESAEKLG